MAPPEFRSSSVAGAEPRETARRLFAELAEAGSDGRPGITRDTYGAGENRAHEIVAREAGALGLEVSRDAALNTYMTLPGCDRSAPAILIGSHLDSVPNGGNFDGAAGVVAGLIALAELERRGVRPACDVTVMGIRAEESAWFQVSYVGSRSALGTLPEGALQARRVDTGRTLADHIATCGGDPEALARGDRHLDPRRIRAFLELHIEQAPSLVEAGLPIAIGTCIPGNFRHPRVRIEGAYDHVGTPRRFRRDAVAAGADIAAGLDAIWANEEAKRIAMACTLGRFHTNADRHGLTTVAGELEFSLDIRAYDAGVLAGLERRWQELVRDVAARRGLRIDVGARAEAPVGPCSPGLIEELAMAAADLGIPHTRMGSPASHDAAAFAQAGVPIGMVFVRNSNGSHNPDEHMEIDDFMAGTQVLLGWLLAKSDR